MANTPVTNGMSVAQMAAIINTQGEQGDDHETRIDTLEAITPVTAEELAAVSEVAESAFSGLGNKVDKVTGSRLVTSAEVTKITAIDQVYTSAEKTKLSGVATGATANDTDANLKNRANHTGTQAATTIVEDATHRFVTDTEKSTWNAGTGGGGSVTEAQVLNATGATRLKGGNTGDMSIPLPDWNRKFKASPSTVKLEFVGDSTADLGGNASSLPGIVTDYTYPGELLAAFNVATNMPNFGSNGNTLQNFMANSPAGKGIDDVIASAPDLIIFGYLINDIRQNLLTKDQAKTLVITAINRFLAEIPGVNIVLRMPNSFLSVGSLIVQGSYPDIATAAQAQTDILYSAYKELENYWDSRVVLLNTQDLIYGRKSLSASPLMTDQIHPDYGVMFAELVKIVGYKEPFSAKRAQAAISANYISPWTVYPRVLEQKSDFVLIWEGKYSTKGTNFIYASGDSFDGKGRILPGDIVNIADTLIFQMRGVTVDVVSGSPTSMSLTFDDPNPIPTAAITGGFVKIYRPKFLLNQVNETYFKDAKTYPYRKRIRMSSCGNGYLFVGATLDDDVITKKIAGLQPARFNLSVSDVLVVEGQAALILSSATFQALNTTILQINKTGDYTTYTNKFGYIYGNHPFENDSTDLNNNKLGLYNASLSTGNGTIGQYLANGGTIIQDPAGNKFLEGILFKTGTVPGGNTITNTVAKTYFASVASFGIGGFYTSQVINLSGSGRLTTGATPGNITIGLDLSQTATPANVSNLGNTGTVALPASVTGLFFKFNIDVFVVLKAGSATLEVQGDITLANGTIIPFTNIDVVTGANLDVAEDFKLFTTFTVASASNSITLRTLKVLSA